MKNSQRHQDLAFLLGEELVTANTKIESLNYIGMIKMKTRWDKLILQISLWLVLEALFNLIGIDELADYSEFLMMPKNSVELDFFLAN